MPWLTPELPWQDSASPLASHASYEGARQAEGRSGSQTLRLLELYAKVGPLTDWDAAKQLGLQRSTVNARRRPLVKRGIVVAVDMVVNRETWARNTRWGLAPSTAGA